MKKDVIIGLLLALLVAAVLSPFASTSPDGLERVAEDKGFIDRGEGKEVIKSPIPDYEVPSIANKTFAGISAGIIGTILTFITMFGLVKGISFFRKKDMVCKE